MSSINPYNMFLLYRLRIWIHIFIPALVPYIELLDVIAY